MFTSDSPFPRRTQGPVRSPAPTHERHESIGREVVRVGSRKAGGVVVGAAETTRRFFGVRVRVGGTGFEGVEGVAERRRGFQRECGALLVGSRSERVFAVIEHLLGEATALGGGLDA